MFQKKEHDKTQENMKYRQAMFKKKFLIMIVKVTQDLGKRTEAETEKMQEMFNKDLEDLKNKQREQYNN